MTKKSLFLCLCMFQIEAAFSSALFSVFAFLDLRDACAIYHTELVPALLHDRGFLFSLLLSLLFLITSCLTLRSFFAQSRQEGIVLSGKHIRAIAAVSVLIPIAVFLLMLLAALLFAPIERLPVKCLLWSGDLGIFAAFNIVSSKKLLKWMKETTWQREN